MPDITIMITVVHLPRRLGRFPIHLVHLRRMGIGWDRVPILQSPKVAHTTADIAHTLATKSEKGKP